MVNREDCVAAINKFIKTKNPKDAVILIKYLDELNGKESEEDKINYICNSPALLETTIHFTLEELETKLKINRITDKNNNLITVF